MQCIYNSLPVKPVRKPWPSPAGMWRILAPASLSREDPARFHFVEGRSLRRLILLRHTKSDWPEGVADHERPLAKRGQRAGPVIGAYMAEAGLVPALAIVSTARRTQETWALVRPAFAAPIPTVDERRIYEAPAGRLLAVVRNAPDDRPTLLLVGHNPGLADMAALLIGTGAPHDLASLRDKYPTGGLAVIDFQMASWRDVAAGTGHLAHFATPRSLDRRG